MTTKPALFSLNPRTLAAFTFDVCAAGGAWLLAFWLRFNFDTPAEFHGVAVGSLLWVLPLFTALFYISGCTKGFGVLPALPTCNIC